jgi:ABC-2 type transport system ATP-binding protein
MDENLVIETQSLTKTYGKARGIEKLDLRVKRGEIFGFLGPNGAGKTTTIRTLLDIIHPTRGTALVLGLDPRKDGQSIRSRVGYLPGELALYPNLTGREILDYSAHLRGGVPHAEIDRLAKLLEIDLNRPARAYSHGNRQKVGIILALLHKPELVVLDEPTNGLDPLVQQVFYEMVEEIRKDGRTVFFSSHVLPEVERLCDRVGLLREGKLAAVETVSGLKQKAIRRIDFIFENPVPVESFSSIVGVTEVRSSGSTLSLVVQGNLDALIKAVARFPLRNIVTYEPNLEEFFLAFYREGGSHAA